VLLGAAIDPIEEVIPSIAPLTSLIAGVVVIAVFAGVEYSFVAIPAQTALQEELPTDVRGRIFGILNTLLSLASFAPVILAPAVADVVNIFLPGTGIPIVMAILGLLTLWAGIASWRRNASEGLHEHDRQAPPGDIARTEAPGLPNSPEPAWTDDPSGEPVGEPAPQPIEAPHRHRRRRRRAVDDD
jgi:MFS family permease